MMGLWAVVTLLAANFPFALPRLSLVGRMLLWLICYAVSLQVANLLEAQHYLSTHTQSWEFYVVTLALFAVAATPTVVWRYFWHKA